MKVFPREVKAILNTLPIGYYAGCRVPMTLDEKGDSSYIDLINNNITISFHLIEKGLEKVNDPDYLETAIRSMLYHEVSHAILTPRGLTCNEINNIFEDERIETLFATFYMNVDFKRNVKLINDWDSYCMTPPKDALDAFYRAVRYRVGKTEWTDEVSRIIRYYSYLNATERYCYCSSYERSIKNLYDKIAKEFPSTPPEEMMGKPSEGSGKGEKSEQDSSTSKNESGSPDSSKNFSGDMIKSKSDDSSASADSSNADKAEDADGKEDKDSKSATETDKSLDKFSKRELEEIRKMIKSALSSVENSFYDAGLSQTLGRIIESFNKKTGSGSAMQGYSGIINPRLVGRPDYRIFERQSTEKGTNKFGTVHLNLFLDESGSFCCNEKETNKLIASLNALTKTNKNFSIDIVYCGMGERLAKKNELAMHCGGGNRLDSEVYKLYRDLQKPHTYNYNIVLFDGDAFSDVYRGEREEYKKNFGAFNNSNCTIISDPSNAEAIKTYATSARKIFTNNYLSELTKNVVEALQFAFH